MGVLIWWPFAFGNLFNDSKMLQSSMLHTSEIKIFEKYLVGDAANFGICDL